MMKLCILVAVVVCAVSASSMSREQSRESNEQASYQPMQPSVYPKPNIQKPPKCDISIDYTNVPGSCTKFRRCSNGYLWILRCPYNTVWDNKARTCARPELVIGPCGTLKPAPQPYVAPSVYPTYPTPSAPTQTYPAYPTTTTTTTTEKPYPAY